ncbi:single-stranded DNA-binding protein [Devriesea agamarum]|uniref:single-stranded DNA-binding protein n=1 Tax=Devriesea agamarum TaxID=472569 RepID=UPI00071CFED7|nr:single-stranded DNA-binding protein [Devriesea agamarum]
MAGDTIITVVGNLTANPDLKFTQTGTPYALFTVASTPRTFNRQTGQWEDGEALFMRCTLWHGAAENMAESLEKGMRVIVQGRLKQRSYDDHEGNKRTIISLDVDEIGPSLRYATAKPVKVQRGQQGGLAPFGAQQAAPAQNWTAQQQAYTPTPAPMPAPQAQAVPQQVNPWASGTNELPF